MLQKDSFTLFNMYLEDKEKLKNNMCYCVVSSLSVVRCSGEQVRDYLQGQITQDIALLNSQQGIYTAILTPSGKCVSEAWVIESGHNQIDMIVPSACSDALVQRLRMFSLGYQLRIGVVVDQEVLAITIPPSNPLSLYSICPQYGGISLLHGQWVIHSKNTPYPDLEMIEEKTWEAWEVLNGMPRFMLDWDQNIYPLNASLQDRQGISFEKGCYVGQEVASRMHWRKLVKTVFRTLSVEEEPVEPVLISLDGIEFGSFKRVVFDHFLEKYICLSLLILKKDDFWIEKV